jgi:hypothetical protein
VRVTIQQIDPGNATIKIEGKIAGRNVAELERAWQELAPTLGGKKLSVDLRGVTFMDGNAKHLLAEIHAKTDAEFIADTPLTKYFAQQAQQDNRISIRADSEFQSELRVRRSS